VWQESADFDTPGFIDIRNISAPDLTLDNNHVFQILITNSAFPEAQIHIESSFSILIAIQIR
jgi:hypothetical protein